MLPKPLSPVDLWRSDGGGLRVISGGDGLIFSSELSLDALAVKVARGLKVTPACSFSSSCPPLEDFRAKKAITSTAATAAKTAITIPAMAPPDRPPLSFPWSIEPPDELLVFGDLCAGLSGSLEGGGGV
eukprot:Gb_28991 [translate_table: standard]